MTLKTTGGSRPFRSHVDLLFGAVFLLAAIRWLLQGALSGVDWLVTLADSRFWLVALISILFFLALRYPRVRLVEPFLFLAISTIPFFQSPESIFGFGFFAVGSIMLFVDGHLSRRPMLKLILLGLYLLTLLIASSILTRTSIETTLALPLYMVAFFLFIFLTFQDKIIVFVRASKPVVRLSEHGLTDKEVAHLQALLAGHSMKEIAWQHGVKESTIRNSLSRAYHRLGFTDKAQLFQWAEAHEIQP